MSATLLIIQDDCVGRLMASDLFADVAIFQQRKNLTESEVNQLLQTLKGRSGKIGTCIMVQMPVLDVVDPNLPGPSTEILQSFLVIEHPTLNASSQGTGKSAEYLAEEALRLFHHFVPFGVSQVFTGKQSAIVPTDIIAGCVAYVVTLTTRVQLTIPPKAVRPIISASGSLVTITTATAGADVYFTTDGSYPSAANAAATLYTAPFTQARPATIRTAASKSALQQSDIAQLTIS